MPSIPLIVNQRDAIRLYAALKDSFSELRGFDLVTSKGKRVRIPRTTNADVRMLLAQWVQMVMGATGHIGTPAFNKMIAKWRPAHEELLAEAVIEEPEEIFSDNVRFWTTTARLAIVLQGIGVVPDTWTMVVESISEAIEEAPELISDITGSAAGAVVKVAGAIAKGAGKVVGGFFEGFGFVGIGLLAAAAYVYTTKKRKRA